MKILAIDDNRDNLTTLKAILHDAFPEAAVLTAQNGPDGIQLALTEDPDVILLDIVMPGMDGFEVCQQLKRDEAVRHIPIVFLTALKTDRISRIRALDAGAEAFLAKPIDEVELIAQVRAMTRIKAAHVREQSEKERLADLVAGQTRQLAEELKERREAEKALRQSEEVMRLTLRATTDGIWNWNFITNELSFSERYYTMLGYQPDEFPPTFESWKNLIHPDDLASALRVAQEYLKTKPNEYENDFRLRTKDGCYRWIRAKARVVERNEAGDAVLMIGNHEDITERKRGEERFRRSQAMLARTERVAHVGSWEWEIAEDVVTWSDELFRIHKLDPDKGTPNWAQHDVLYHPEDFEHMRQVVERAISDGTPYELELRALRSDGETRICLARGFLEMGPDGKAVRLFGSLQDITDRKRAEEEREKLQAQLLQAQKMESVGRLAGGVAHDFNNNLQTILGYSDLVLGDMSPDQPLYEDMLEIRNAAKRSTAIVRQLLAFARKEIIAPVVVDLNDAITGMLKMLRRLIGEDIDLICMPGADLWDVKMDPGQVDQVLANLVVNARDAIKNQGKVEVGTENVSLDEACCAGHPGCAPGEYVRLTVRDTGCGMDRETVEKIFEPFFTTKEKGKGTGLGLPTVYGIVRQNNGYVQVQSQPGQGTCFDIYLPRHRGEPAGALKTDIADQPLSGTETILLVEDQGSVLRTGERMLTALGYRVLAVGAPEDAIVQAEKQPGEMALLMTDVVMPATNGRELAERIRQIRPGIRCLYMSGFTEDIIARKGVLEKGAVFIQKPFSMQDLGKKVREALTTGDAEDSGTTK